MLFQHNHNMVAYQDLVGYQGKLKTDFVFPMVAH